MKEKFLWFGKAFFLFAFAVFVTGCVKKQNDSSITVVCSTFPCYDAARAVLGSCNGTVASLSLLVKPGAEVHSFDPSPADIISIQKSDLFIFIGGESDEWIQRILNSSDRKGAAEEKGVFLKLMDFVSTIDEHHFEDDFDDFNEEKNSERLENPHEQDEHIWTSPENELKILDAVCSALCTIAEKKGLSDLPHIFSENKDTYSLLVENVEKATKNVVDFAEEKYIVMADRFPFVYFAEYYGLGYDAAFNGCSTAVESSAATISRLIDSVNKRKLPAVFYIELGNHKIADVIADACGVDAILLQSVQNVTKDDFENGESWVSLMERNALALERGLR